MHLVVGATGFLGSQICRRLTDGARVRAMVRETSDPSQVEALRSLGVEIVTGDLKDRHSLDRACHGVRTVISTANSIRSRQEGDSLEATDLAGHQNLVEAASGAGASHFAFVSFSGNLGGDDPLTIAKRATESALRQSGMSWTILRPTVFMEVWLSPHLGFDFPNAKATIYGSGDAKISWISLVDVAEFAVLAAEQTEAKNAILELGGPEALSPHEVVKIFEDVTGRSFELQHVPVEALEARKQNAQSSYDKTFATLMLGLASGDSIPMERTLEHFPVKLTSVREYAERVSGGR